MEDISSEFEDFLIEKAHKLVHQDPYASPEVRQFFLETTDVQKLISKHKFKAPVKTFSIIQSNTPPSLDDWREFSDDWHMDKNVWVIYALIMVKTDKYLCFNHRKR